MNADDDEIHNNINNERDGDAGIELSSDVLLASVHKEQNGRHKDDPITESRESGRDANKTDSKHEQEPKR